MKHVIVCGGRDYAAKLATFKELDSLQEEIGFEGVIQGGAKGADALALRWALVRGVPVLTRHALWHAEGRSAGVRRNLRMLEPVPVPSGVIAFPGGRGTEHMVVSAEKAGVPVVDLRGAFA